MDTNQYRNSYLYTYPNPYGHGNSYAKRDTKRNSEPLSNFDLYQHPNRNGYFDRNTDAYPIADEYADQNPYQDGYSNEHAHGHADSD